MLGAEFQYRDKVQVGVLGATGAVGQKFIELLAEHPWFELTALAASERSVGKPYKEVVNWILSKPLPFQAAEMVVQPCEPNLPCNIVFSGLDASVAGEIEKAFAEKGYIVVSNASHHRMGPNIPLLIPEVNPEHLELIQFQTTKGKIVTNPNCSVIGLALALKPLQQQFGIEALHVTTLQAVSGAGYPGVPSLDIFDNIIPFIRNEEEKLETEPLKILGMLHGHKIQPAEIKISAQCNRVPVTDGHTACVSIKLKAKPSMPEMIAAWENFTSLAQSLDLPLAPKRPIHYFPQENYPQPRLHRHLDKGMAVSIGRLQPCPLLDYKFTLLSHNTLRGAAGCALLNAELMMKKGHIYW